MGDVWAKGGPEARRQFSLDVIGAVVFGLILGALLAAAGQWVGVAVVVLLAFALALRHRQVALMVALAVAAALLQVITATAVYPADAAYAVLFFALGAHPRRELRVFGLCCAIIATVAAGVFIAVQGGPFTSLGHHIASGFAFAAFTAPFTVGGWGAGNIRRLNRRAVQARIDANLDAAERRRLQDAFDQEQERARIATDMHDVVAHSWAVVAAQADGARYALRDSPDAAERALAVIGETARSAIADLGAILARLRQQQEPLGVTPGPGDQQQLFARMQSAGMQIIDEEFGARSASPLLELTAHRLLGESLTNALKHGDLAEPVTVRQDWRQGYRLTVTNSVSERHTAHGARHGIIGMRERATVLDGAVTSRRVGDRWVLDARLPDPADPNGERT